MMLTEVTSVADAVLPIEAFKAHLRLGSGFDLDNLQDDLLRSFLRASLAAVEARTGKALLSRSFKLALSSWRHPESQDFPIAPVEAVTQVSVVGFDGISAPVASQSYWLERDAQRPALRASGSSLVLIPSRAQAVIEFEAGYGTDWEALPADLRQAVLMLAAHYYEYRSDTGLSNGCMPFGVSSLLERYRAFRVGAGYRR